MVEDVPHLGRGQPPVDRHGDGPEVIGGEDHLEELRAVVGEEPDDIPWSDTTGGQATGQRNGAPPISAYVVARPRTPSSACPVPGAHGTPAPRTSSHRISCRRSLPQRPPSPRPWCPSSGWAEFFGSGLVPTSVAPMSVQATGESRRSPKWEQRRHAIVDTSARVFARQGYHATGIMELCAANDLGKGALYHYIGSKEELLAAIHNRVMDEVMFGADRVAEAGGSLRAIGHAGRRVDRRHPPLSRSRLGLPARVPRAHRRSGRAFRKRRQAYERRVEDVLRAGVATGEFRDLDPWLVARAWLGMHNYTYLWLKPEGRLTRASVARPFAEIFMRGILPVRPRGSRRRIAAVDHQGRSGGPARLVPARYAYAPARSSAVPSPSGWRAAMVSRASSGRPVWIAERKVPGHTQLTRMPSRAYSTAATLASWITAAFVAQYGAEWDHAVRPATEAVSTWSQIVAAA